MTTKTKNNHRQNIEFALFRRDYDLLARYHPALLDHIEAAIGAGVGAGEVRRWVRQGMVGFGQFGYGWVRPGEVGQGKARIQIATKKRTPNDP